MAETAAHRPPSSHLLEEERRSWLCPALKITKRILRGTKLCNHRCRRDGRGVFAETVSSSATGATGGSVYPLFHPLLTFSLSFSVSLSLPLSRFSIRHPLTIPPLGSLAPLALARGCDLKCKLKYSSWYLRANRFDINGASAPHWEREREDIRISAAGNLNGESSYFICLIRIFTKENNVIIKTQIQSL